MFNLLYTEVLKLKRAKVMWLLPIGGLLPTLLNIIIIINNLKNYNIHWESAFKNNFVFMTLIMGVALFSLISGYVFSREYTENTVNTLYTYPVDKYKFIFAKLIVIFIMIYITLVINYVSLLVGGMMLIKESITGSLLIDTMKSQLLIGMMFFALTPVSSLLGVIGKNVIPPIVLGISGVITNIVVVNSKYIDVFPWSIPIAYIFRDNIDDPRSVCINAGIILTGMFIIFLIGLIGYLKKTDIHAGS
ncbi:ABC transporter permease [Crassaminicella indica]|uniref:ABC transporter permease n=1 Tax=Crassaminicella indica TaxID=2855394 RepID=A0ABX8RC49_9CLOT|nr:ABC transporter permease [Crassaminicella indica]QXM06614.1 ABC transporter permease [Crassaminicella indica]